MVIIGDRKFLNTKEISRKSGLSVGWFRKKRFEKCGPPYVKLPKSKTVLYDFEIFQKWMIENMKDGEDE